jgi:integral membrane protein (TIGR01906 family)
MKSIKPSTHSSQLVAGWVLTILLPPILVVTSILLLINPVFLNLEYRRPGFPVDTYGFTLSDRLKYAQVSVAYLLNSQGIESLEKQTLPDGSVLYNERELSHMVDVKAVVQGTLQGWLIGLMILITLTIWARRGNWMQRYWLGVMRGGVLTIVLIFLLLVYLAVNFDALFTQFHKIFFESGSWVFYYSDSLIRLFPLPFWQDCFIVTGSLSLLGGILLGVTGNRRYRLLA